MRDYTSDPNPGPLPRQHLDRLRELVAAMRAHDGPWGEVYGGDQVEPGVFTMPMVVADELAYDALDWLYESDRVFWFHWSRWDEGRAIFEHWRDGTAESLDHLTVRKLITAIARNDRFCEGAWAQLFEDPAGVQLFARLLEQEEELVRQST